MRGNVRGIKFFLICATAPGGPPKARRREATVFAGYQFLEIAKIWCHQKRESLICWSFLEERVNRFPNLQKFNVANVAPLGARDFSRGLEHERTLVSSIFFSFSFSLTPLVDRPLVDNCSAKPPRETSGPQISCLSLKNRQMKMSLTVPIIK